MLDTVSRENAAGGNSPAVFVGDKVKAAIAILGSNPQTVMAAPFHDQDWEIWACSPDNTLHGHSENRRQLPRFDAWFECHAPLEDPTRPFAYLKTVSDMPCVWLRDRRAFESGVFKGARLYPEAELKGTSEFQKIKGKDASGRKVEQIVEIPNNDGLFCPYQFTSSIAYMLAKAIADLEAAKASGALTGERAIGIWGVMQASENEYVYQRPGIQYFLWEAKRRGIKVVANRESCLFDMPQWKW